MVPSHAPGPVRHQCQAGLHTATRLDWPPGLEGGGGGPTNRSPCGKSTQAALSALPHRRALPAGNVACLSQ